MSNTIKAAIQALKGRIADAYTAIVAKGGTLPATQDSANLPTAIASIPSGGGMDGSGLTPTPQVESVVDYIMSQKITELYSNTLITLTTFFQFVTLTKVDFPNLETYGSGTSSAAFYNATPLSSVNMPKLKYILNGNAFRNCSALKTLELPLLVTANQSNMFWGCGSLRRLNLGTVSSLGSSNTFINCTNLIDLELGSGFTTSFNISTWSPTNALSSTSSSLVETGETFANNLEKLLYNIREHIAANLNQSITGKTVTFSSAIYNAIHADAATESAFGVWSIASA